MKGELRGSGSGISMALATRFQDTPYGSVGVQKNLSVSGEWAKGLAQPDIRDFPENKTLFQYDTHPSTVSPCPSAT